jgi:hypothetical protein
MPPSWHMFLAFLLQLPPTTSAAQRGDLPFRPGPAPDLLEGDMAVAESPGSSETRQAFIRPPASSLWTNGVVHYRFDKEDAFE